MVAATALPDSFGLCTLEVSAAALEKDALLRAVVSSASSLLKVDVAKKGGAGGGDHLSLTVGGGSSHQSHQHHRSIQLKQRSSILRALSGPALHYALDGKFACGHFQASTASAADVDHLGSSSSASPQSVLAIAAMNGWMSTTEITVPDLEELERHHLRENAFLIPTSSCCTLADYHVLLLILQQQQPEITSSWDNFPNVCRWMRTCHAQLTDILVGGSPPPPLPKEVSTAAAPAASVVPIFFNGTEDADALLSSTPSTPASKPKQKGENKNKKANNDQQQQKGDGKKKQQQQQQAPKKKQQQQADDAGGDASSSWTISAMDLRVGKISKVWNHEEADKLFCEEIDLGDELGTRQVASGLREHYKLEEMQDRLVVVLANLKARKLVNFPSHGMVLVSSLEKGR